MGHLVYAVVVVMLHNPSVGHPVYAVVVLHNPSVGHLVYAVVVL